MEWWQIGGGIGLGGLILLVGKEVLKLTLGFLFKRTIDAEYVTVLVCKTNREECRGNVSSRILRQAVSLLIEYNDKIPVEKRVEIRNGLIT